MRTVFAAALMAAVAFTALAPAASAQTPSVTDDAKAAKAAAKAKAAEDKKAKAEAKKAAKAEKKAKRSGAREAAKARRKQCGSEWQDLRADGKIEKGMTWPKYYSGCSKRLKAKAA